MEKILTIGEVARLLDVPESTLRFWQEKEMFSVPKDKSNYRQYTMTDLIDIAEMAFYRNIGVPVKEMKNFRSLTLADYDSILEELKAALEEKSRHTLAMLDALALKRSHIENIAYLKTVDFTYGTVPFSCVVPFDYNDREKLIRYTKNPSLYVRCINTQQPEDEVRGIITAHPTPGDAPLWQQQENRHYAIFLVEEVASEGYVNNIPEKLALVQQKHRTGTLLAKFLLSEALGGRRMDYLLAYVELL